MLMRTLVCIGGFLSFESYFMIHNYYYVSILCNINEIKNREVYVYFKHRL